LPVKSHGAIPPSKLKNSKQFSMSQGTNNSNCEGQHAASQRHLSSRKPSLPDKKKLGQSHQARVLDAQALKLKHSETTVGKGFN